MITTEWSDAATEKEYPKSSEKQDEVCLSCYFNIRFAYQNCNSI